MPLSLRHEGESFRLCRHFAARPALQGSNAGNTMRAPMHTTPSTTAEQHRSMPDPEGSEYRSRYDFSGCRNNLEVTLAVLKRKEGLLGDVSRLLAFPCGVERSNNT